MGLSKALFIHKLLKFFQPQFGNNVNRVNAVCRQFPAVIIISCVAFLILSVFIEIFGDLGGIYCVIIVKKCIQRSYFKN